MRFAGGKDEKDAEEKRIKYFVGYNVSGDFFVVKRNESAGYGNRYCGTGEYA